MVTCTLGTEQETPSGNCLILPDIALSFKLYVKSYSTKSAQVWVRVVNVLPNNYLDGEVKMSRHPKWRVSYRTSSS